MILKIKTCQKGFIALMSAVIMSSAMLALAAAVAGIAFWSRFDALDYENKAISAALAESCAQTALLELAKNYGYGSTIPVAGIQVVVEAGKTCKICAVGAENPYKIIIRAVYKNAYTNLKITASLANGEFTIDDWDETVPYAGNCNLP